MGEDGNRDAMPPEHNRDATNAETLDEVSQARVLLAEAELAKAKAELIEAQTAAKKAQTPFIDKIIMRALIPIALTIVGPWAAYTFSVEAQEAKQKAAEAVEGQAETLRTVTVLQGLLKDQKDAWEEARERIAEVERQKAEELAAMSAMVTRFSVTLKMALVQMAVAREMGDAPTTVIELPTAPPQPEPSREDIVGRVTMQMAMPNMPAEEVEKLAGEAYDAMSKRRGKK